VHSGNLLNLEQVLQIAGTGNDPEDEHVRLLQSVEEQMLGRPCYRRPPHIAQVYRLEAASHFSSRV
jgi:hypothetical protein